MLKKLEVFLENYQYISSNQKHNEIEFYFFSPMFRRWIVQVQFSRHRQDCLFFIRIHGLSPFSPNYTLLVYFIWFYFPVHCPLGDGNQVNHRDKLINLDIYENCHEHKNIFFLFLNAIEFHKWYEKVSGSMCLTKHLLYRGKLHLNVYKFNLTRRITEPTRNKSPRTE